MKAIWICPALCGCEVELDADWIDGDVHDEGGRMVSYRHPRGKTIKSVKAVGVCHNHEHAMTDDVDADPYSGAPGYMDVPANPTPDEKLYIYLYRFSGQTLRPATCGCRMYQHFNRRDPQTSVVCTKHNAHTKKCRHHLADDDKHTAVWEELSRHQKVTSALVEMFPADFTAGEVDAQYDDERVLHVKAGRLNPSNRIVLQAAANALVGANKVIVEA